jgi:hypothetical protein
MASPPQIFSSLLGCVCVFIKTRYDSSFSMLILGHSKRITKINSRGIFMHAAHANAAALPPNAHFGPCNPIGAVSACAAMRDKSFNYPSKSCADPTLCDSAIWQLLSTLSPSTGERISRVTQEILCRCQCSCVASESSLRTLQPHWRRIWSMRST